MEARILEKLKKLGMLTYESHTVIIEHYGMAVIIFSDIHLSRSPAEIIKLDWLPINKDDVKEAIFLFHEPEPSPGQKSFFATLNTLTNPRQARMIVRNALEKQGYEITELNGYRCYDAKARFSHEEAAWIFMRTSVAKKLLQKA